MLGGERESSRGTADQHTCYGRPFREAPEGVGGSKKHAGGRHVRGDQRPVRQQIRLKYGKAEREQRRGSAEHLAHCHEQQNGKQDAEKARSVACS